MDNINIPSNYIPFNKVNLCSNNLENVRYFFGINDNPPLLIGQGDDKPICWINVLNNGIWNEAVTANRSNYLPLQVFAHDNKLFVQLANTVILDSYVDEEGALIITKLDLKPLGFNIEGDQTQLNVGGNALSFNSINGGKFFVGLG